MFILGVDEAGRGPVIGPLVITGCMAEEAEIVKLQQMGAKDSKLLTPRQREFLFEKIKAVVKFHIIQIEPQEIDAAVNSDTLNLNWLEAHKTAEIINVLKPDKAIIDCPSTNIKKYEEYIKKLLKHNAELMCCHRAEQYPIVAAASIISKVTRDREIEKIKKKYGDFGSGYPSDPKTKDFLGKNWDNHPEMFRKSWASWKNHSKAKQQMKVADF